MSKPTLLESLSQESDSVMNALSNMTKPTLHELLCQEPEFIENALSTTTKPTLLEALSQESAPLKIENDTFFIQLFFINCFKSKYMFVF